MRGILIGFILFLILIGVGGFFFLSQRGNNQPPGGQGALVGCNPPSAGETAFSGKVATFSPPGHPGYKQYILQSSDDQTVYLRTTPAQESSLQSEMGKDVQVNGTPFTSGSWSAGVKVITICP